MPMSTISCNDCSVKHHSSRGMRRGSALRATWLTSVATPAGSATTARWRGIRGDQRRTSCCTILQTHWANVLDGRRSDGTQYSFG